MDPTLSRVLMVNYQLLAEGTLFLVLLEPWQQIWNNYDSFPLKVKKCEIKVQYFLIITNKVEAPQSYLCANIDTYF